MYVALCLVYPNLSNIIWVTMIFKQEPPTVLHQFLQSTFTAYRVYQNDWSGFEVDYIHKYGEQNYKY